MTKIKITKEQYEKILINEQSNRLINEGSDLTFNNSGDVLMGFSKLLGLKLTNQNKLTADKATNNPDILLAIKKTILDQDKREQLIDDLKNKGMSDPEKKLIHNYEQIVINFNKYAEALGLTDRLNNSGLLNAILRK